MKKAVLVLVIYTAVLALMASAPVRLPERCPRPLAPLVTVTVAPKPVVAKPEPKLEACYDVLIPFIMVIHFHCVGEGFGGGGGSAW